MNWNVKVCLFLHVLAASMCFQLCIMLMSIWEIRGAESGHLCHKRWSMPASLLLLAAQMAAHGMSPFSPLQPLNTISGFLKKKKKLKMLYLVFSADWMSWQLTIKGSCGPVVQGLCRCWPPPWFVREFWRNGLNWCHTGKGNFKHHPGGFRRTLQSTLVAGIC